jgi:hypothetical protein
MEDFRADSRKLCIGGGRYIWGFSRSLVFVGVALETVWCYVCIVLLLLATQQSELVRRGRSTAGVLRTILDISDPTPCGTPKNSCGRSYRVAIRFAMS